MMYFECMELIAYAYFAWCYPGMFNHSDWAQREIHNYLYLTTVKGKRL